MGAALSVFILLSLSVFIIRVASVALRITGLTDTSARFQALSAFTGTGFTTSEAETVINYPVRRRIVAVLMIIGNVGLVTVLATLVVSLVRTDGDVDAVVVQLTWLFGGLLLLWFLVLNNTADRVLCYLIARAIQSTTDLGRRGFHRLVQIGNGHSVCEHPATQNLIDHEGGSIAGELSKLDLLLLAVRSQHGEYSNRLTVERPLGPGDTLILYGPDESHDAMDSIGKST